MFLTSMCKGSAFYAFGIQAPVVDFATTTADLSFYIDGVLSGTYTYTPPEDSSQYAYNVLLWGSSSISPGQHTFTLQNGQSGGIPSLVLFDYAVYTRCGYQQSCRKRRTTDG